MLAERHFRFGFQINLDFYLLEENHRNWPSFVQSESVDPAGLAGQEEEVRFPSRREHYSGQS